MTHAWSEGGLHWHWSKTASGPPNHMAVGSGDTDNERPRVVLDANGDLGWLSASMPRTASSWGQQLQLMHGASGRCLELQPGSGNAEVADSDAAAPTQRLVFHANGTLCALGGWHRGRGGDPHRCLHGDP